jgi:hypothetical protein
MIGEKRKCWVAEELVTINNTEELYEKKQCYSIILGTRLHKSYGL